MGFSGNLTAICKDSTLNWIDDHQDQGCRASLEVDERMQTKRAAALAALSSVGLLLPSNLLRRCARIRIAQMVKAPARRILLSLTGALVRGNQR